MRVRVQVGLPHCGQIYRDFLFIPTQTSGHGTQCDGLQALHQHRTPIQADLPEMAVLGPGTNGCVEDALGDVGEAGVLHVALEQRGRAEGDADVGQAVGDHVPVVEHGVVGGERVVMAHGHVVDLLAFEPGSGFEMSDKILLAMIAGRDGCGDRGRRVFAYRSARSMSLGQLRKPWTVWRVWI